jgi:hypothetical protein
MGVDRAWDLIAPQGQVVDLVHDNVEVLIPKGTINEPAWRDIARTIASSEGSPKLKCRPQTGFPESRTGVCPNPSMRNRVGIG